MEPTSGPAGGGRSSSRTPWVIAGCATLCAVGALLVIAIGIAAWFVTAGPGVAAWKAFTSADSGAGRGSTASEEGRPQVQVAYWPAESGGGLLIVSATVPTQTPLPATIDLPLPAGYTPVWVGEIAGGRPEDDTEQPSVIVERGGGRAVRVTCKAMREVQYEATPDDAPAMTGMRSFSLAWLQSGEAADVTFSVQLPVGAQRVRISPAPEGSPIDSGTGQRLWTLPSRWLSVGDTFDLTVDCTLP
jgi:hypothetical protein